MHDDKVAPARSQSVRLRYVQGKSKELFHVHAGRLRRFLIGNSLGRDGRGVASRVSTYHGRGAKSEGAQAREREEAKRDRDWSYSQRHNRNKNEVNTATMTMGVTAGRQAVVPTQNSKSQSAL